MTGSSGVNLAAQARAWVLEPDGSDWVGVDNLDIGRAYFRLVPDRFGGAMAIGGVGTGWGYGAVPMAVPACGERFVPDSGEWVRLDPCGAAGQGMLPPVAVSDGRGVITMQGRMDDPDGGEEYGIIAFPPGM